MLHIPIAHIHGGEETEGALDNAWRHAITKLSYWHFSPYEKARQRIIQMGEDPARVFNVGAPGIDNLVRLPLLSREELAVKLDIRLVSPVILFTYHPEEFSAIPVEQQIGTVIAALEQFPQATLLITGANADAGGRDINQALQALAKRRSNTLFRMSFGSLLYLSAMRIADAVVGNSSSGMIETPALGRATVNIGDRQMGRLIPPSVLSCRSDIGEISDIIAKAISSGFQKTLAPSTVFGVPGQVGVTIAEHLIRLDIPTSLRKPFHEF